MNPMTAADHGGAPMPSCLGCNRFAQSFQILKKDVDRLHHLKRKSGINHVTARQAEMEPSTGWRANVFGDVSCERDDVMVQSTFELLAAVEVELGAGFHLRQIFFGDQAFRRERLAGEQFNLQPDFEFTLLAP